MADIKLFNIDGKVTELQSGNVTLEKELQTVIEETPLGRLGTPREIAELIYFLASEKSDFITGQVITCDGGFIL